VSGGGRTPAECLHEIVRAIDRAAAVMPPPEGLALPQFSIPTRQRRVYPAQLVGFRETLADKAREWGVYVAFGLRCRGLESTQPCVGLMDPDGDMAGGDDLHARAQPGFWSRFVPTPSGWLAVADPRRPDASLFDGAPASILLIVPCGSDQSHRLATGPKPDVFQQRSERNYLAVTRFSHPEAGNGSGPAGAVYGARGGRIAWTSHEAAGCDVVEVELDAGAAGTAAGGAHRPGAGPPEVESNRPCADSGS